MCFCCKQKTAYEMRISDWSSDVCSSDLSHAAAYALLTWQSSWLKLHHPAAFYAAALTYNSEDFDKLRKIIREARERGIEMLPPSIEKSGVAFEPDTTDDEIGRASCRESVCKYV